jgi:hypothetical protein
MEQQQAPIKRGAIIGTAPTFKNTPWDDPTLDRFSLNDAYVLPGVRNITGWFDLHPIPEMVFRPRGERAVRPEHAPVGAYLRPEGHLEWLKTRNFPVYLQKAPAGWTNAKEFPFAAIEQRYGSYFSSTPAWMLAWMLMEGYREIHIYGIHLATEWEYIHQRPNMEFLIGMALAQGVQFVIPDKSSLLKGKHKYALEHKPNLDLERVERRIALVKNEGQQLQKRLAGLSWYARGQKADILARLRVLELELADCRQEQARLAALARVA